LSVNSDDKNRHLIAAVADADDGHAAAAPDVDLMREARSGRLEVG
jgi:hypothetical protein